MTAVDWKPGDVAIAAYPIWGGSNDETTYAETRICRYGHGWARLDNPFDFVNDDSPYRPADPRPLVVIDYDDREQVERLLEAWCSLSEGYAELLDEPWSMPAMRLRQALRKFANPTSPRPDEPTGLGAVVEDVDGEKWLRWEVVDRHPKPWTVAGAVRPTRAFADIAAVKVLNEGWSA